MRGTTPFRKVTNDNREAEERLFLDFMVHSTRDKLWAPGTIKMRLAAIRARHVALGYDNPLETMGRVYLALAGYKERYGRDERRRPITVAMLRWIRARLAPSRSHDGAAI